MTRDEHLDWCKRRALAYLPGNVQDAVTSMLSDLGKHDETRPVLEIMGMAGILVIQTNNPAEARRFIEGFR